jgi:hypothetical protein
MTISTKMVNDTLRRVSDSNTLRDMLLEFEQVLDSLDLYSYQNWAKGEVLEGPFLHRHWIDVKLIYDKKYMPDPAGAKRLIDRGIFVKFTENTLIRPKKITSMNDFEVVTRPDGSTKRRAKLSHDPVWVINIRMPRRLVDEFKTDIIAIGDGEYLDTEALNAEGEILRQTMMGPGAGGNI